MNFTRFWVFIACLVLPLPNGNAADIPCEGTVELCTLDELFGLLLRDYPVRYGHCVNKVRVPASSEDRLNCDIVTRNVNLWMRELGTRMRGEEGLHEFHQKHTLTPEMYNYARGQLDVIRSRLR